MFHQDNGTIKSARITATVAGVAILVLILGMVWQIDISENRRYQQSLRTQYLDKVSLARAKLESSLNARLHLVRGLAAFTKSKPTFDFGDFQKFVHDLLSGMSGIRSLQLAPAGIVTFIYPIEGNMAAIGHNLLADPKRKQAVQMAIDKRKFIIAGPLPLRQGGIALIGRLPIFISANSTNSDKSEIFWGLAIIIIDLQPLLDSAGISEIDEGIKLAIRGKDGLGASGELFYGSKDIFQQNPVILDVLLPNGTWQIGAVPENGWQQNRPGRYWLWLFGGGLAVVLAFLMWLLVREPLRLSSIVARKTSDLQRNETRMRVIIDNIIEGIFTTDYKGTIECLNTAACRIFGYNDGVELLGRNVSDLVPEPHKRRHDQYIKEHLESLQPPDKDQNQHNFHGKVFFKRESYGVKKSGEPVPIEVTVCHVRSGRDAQFIASIRDISERKKAQEELEQTRMKIFHNDKMAAMGNLAAGIVHEIGNPTAAITGLVESLQESCGLMDNDNRANLELIHEQVSRLTTITRDVSEFSNVQAEEFQPCNLNDVIQNSLKLFNFDQRLTKVATILQLDRQIPAVMGTPNQLRQVILNILMNALDATSEDLQKNPCITISTCLPADSTKLRVTIEDNGVGMSPETSQRAFDAFFTTKPVGKGTGMGLSICHTIVEKHLGEIIIESNPDWGSRIHVLLPVAKN